MDIYLLLLRLIHIVAGVFWAGGLFTLALFILPSVNTSMPEGGKVMQRLMAAYHFPVYMLSAAALTLLSGLLMYAKQSRGFSMSWIGSLHGMVLTIGGFRLLWLSCWASSSTSPGPIKGRIGKEGCRPSCHQKPGKRNDSTPDGHYFYD
jgi:uncharacterized membrane protein